MNVYLIVDNSYILPEPQDQCRTTADIGFLVDSCGTHGEEDFSKVKKFIKDVAGAINVGPGASHVGLVLYGADVEIISPLNANLNSFQNTVDKLRHKRGVKRMDKALRLASSRLFTKGEGGRDGVDKICLVITDGKQTKVKDATELRDAVRPLKVCLFCLFVCFNCLFIVLLM